MRPRMDTEPLELGGAGRTLWARTSFRSRPAPGAAGRGGASARSKARQRPSSSAGSIRQMRLRSSRSSAMTAAVRGWPEVAQGGSHRSQRGAPGFWTPERAAWEDERELRLPPDDVLDLVVLPNGTDRPTDMTAQAPSSRHSSSYGPTCPTPTALAAPGPGKPAGGRGPPSGGGPGAVAPPGVSDMSGQVSQELEAQAVAVTHTWDMMLSSTGPTVLPSRLWNLLSVRLSAYFSPGARQVYPLTSLCPGR